MHARLIEQHGGLAGPARMNDLEAVLARPEHLLADAESTPTIQRLAAAYGFALARGHCFPDGNKRIALVAIDVFLRMNGFALNAPEVDAVSALQALAGGEMSELMLAQWIAQFSLPHGA